MAARIQEKIAFGTSASAIISFDSTTTNGNYLIGVVSMKTTANFSTLPSGWGFAAIANGIILGFGGNTVAIIYYRDAPPTTSLTITLPASVDWTIILAEYSGLANLPAVQTNANHDSSQGDSGSVTTTTANMLLIAGLCSVGNTSFSSPSNSFTIVNQVSGFPGFVTAYLELFATTTSTYNVTASDGGAACNGLIASFAEEIVRCSLISTSALLATGHIFRTSAALISITTLTSTANANYLARTAIIANAHFHVAGGFPQQGASGLQSTAILTPNTLLLTIAIITQNSDTSFLGIAFSLTVTFTTLLGAPVTNLTGEVVFYDGITQLGTSLIDTTGMATFIITGLALGHHSLSASYLGDSNYSTVQTNLLNHDISNVSINTSGAGDSRHIRVKRLISFLSSISTNPSSGVSYYVAWGGVVVGGLATQTLDYNPSGVVQGVSVGGSAVVFVFTTTAQISGSSKLTGIPA